MRYFTLKLEAVKLSAVCIGVCVLFGALCLTGSFSALGSDVFSSAEVKDLTGDIDGRLRFLKSHGWEVLDTPVMEKEITVPKSFDEVYTRYNEDIQLPSGFDLRKYAGKQVTLYTYIVINYPTEDEVTANILVYENKIIGGDICSVNLDGFMHGFTPPDGVVLPSSEQLYD